MFKQHTATSATARRKFESNDSQKDSKMFPYPSFLSFVSPSRRFIREGVLTKVCRSKDQAYDFFLFNDLLVYGSRIPISGLLNLHRQIEIDKSFQVVNMEDEPGKFLFMVVSSSKSFKVYAANAGDKAEWMKNFADTMAYAERHTARRHSHRSTADVRPVWQQDSTSSLCPLCKDKFTMINRRHHCRRCGKLVCGDCSKRRAVIKTGGPRERLCDPCVQEMSKTHRPSEFLLVGVCFRVA